MTDPGGRANGRVDGRTGGRTGERWGGWPCAARDPVRRGTNVGWAPFLVAPVSPGSPISQMAFVTSDTHPLASLSARSGVDAASASLGCDVAELLRREGELFRHSGTTRTRTYGMNVPFMQLERHGWNIHAV